jgi:hypothetical protein
MGIRIHSLILATSLVATVAVGIASAAVFNGLDRGVAPKGDRLPVAEAASDVTYVTVETREPGTSVLNRMPVVE